LSKVLTSTRESAAAERALTLQNDPLGLQTESLERVRKFLPLKLDATQREEQAETAAHRTVKVLLITMDDSKADSTLLFINTTVEVSIADYDIDSETIQLSQFEAIFIDGDYYEDDSVELVTHFCSKAFNGLPVLLCAKAEALRQRAVEAGARACSRLPLEALNEETFDTIFGPELATDPLRSYTLDIFRLQEERATVPLAPESMHVSQEGKGFEGSQSRMKRIGEGSKKVDSHRDSVTVESKSHSLVGTLHFIAPEAVRLRKYGKPVDWWACGVTIYECLVRKHLFQGEEKQAVFENIMNAPIVLDELAPSGEVVVGLVRGLLNRDIKRRLGSHGADAVKAHKLFEKIEWATVSTSNPVHKPAQFVNKKYRAEDRDLFYGRNNDFDSSLRPETLEERNTTSMQKYLQNKKRSKLTGHSSGLQKVGLRGSGKLSGGSRGGADRQRSRSLSSSAHHSGSLELVPEGAHEAHEEEHAQQQAQARSGQQQA
jgi:serine/threonine protein kinase